MERLADTPAFWVMCVIYCIVTFALLFWAIWVFSKTPNICGWHSWGRTGPWLSVVIFHLTLPTVLALISGDKDWYYMYMSYMVCGLGGA